MLKMFNRFFLFVLLAFFSAFAVSCGSDSGGGGGGGESTPSYIVSFYDDGVILNQYGRTVASGMQITLPTPTKLNYTFNGWLLNGVGSPLTGTYTVTANTFFNAKWTADTPTVTEYTVSFYDGGDLIPGLGYTVESGTQITLPSYTKQGYSLDGWLLNGVGSLLTGSCTITVNTTFVAQWSLINPGITEYTISFFDDGVILNQYSRTVASGTPITLPAITKLGYTLDGWLLSGVGTPLTGTYSVNSNTIFTAKWTASNPGVTEYPVSFYDDGVILPQYSRTVSSGTQITLPSALSKIGYTFNGWLLNGLGSPLTDTHTVTADAVFIAKWTSNRVSVTEYAVFFYDNGFIIPESSITVASGAQITLPELTKTGYTFDGWLVSFDELSADNSNLSENETLTVTCNVYLHARFTATNPVRYTVSYYDEAGYKYSDIGGSVNSGEVISLPPRTRRGYMFDGWFESNIGSPINGAYTVTGNTSFYAKFTIPNAVFITTAAELYNIRNNPSGKYILAKDISLSEYNYDAGWEPIGTSSKPFMGILDGNGFKITDLDVDREIAGLFAYIGSGAVINNLTLEVTSVKGIHYAGALAGRIACAADNRTIVSNVHIIGTGSIQASSNSGGISGYLENAILFGCSNSREVSSSSSSYPFSGGIAGQITGIITITNCYNTGNVSSPTGGASGGGSGGIVGNASNLRSGSTAIANCYNTGNVSSSSNSGGIVGHLVVTATVTNCYNTGNVSSSAGAIYASGGIAGAISTNGTTVITNCYNTGNVSSRDASGGLVGLIYGTATVMNNAAINEEIGVTVSYGDIGRIFNRVSSSASITAGNNFALSTMRAVGGSFDFTPVNHGTSKTDALLKTRSTYEDAVNGDGAGGLGWQFGNDAVHPWKMPEGGGYPILYWQE
jgi:uncharacterized repeat protein (TIGR02543 family)